MAAISAIRAYEPVSYTSTVANAYAVDNQSGVSPAYAESVQNMGSVDDVDPANPVRYANAHTETNQVSSLEEDLEENQRMNKAYNSIADAFGGRTTSYGRGLDAQSYQAIGQNLDVYA